MFSQYYRAQRGGEIPVFRGGRQTGAGLGDILKGFFRFLMPVALRGIQAFAGNTLAGARAGMPLAAAAKSAIMPTISAVAGSAAPTVSRLVNSVIPGLVTQNGATAPQTGRGILFDGENGIPTTVKAIKQYKRAAADEVDVAPAKRSKRKRESHKVNSATGVHYNF